jgi:hypothetical protein
VRAAPNREMAVDWRDSPWRGGGTAMVRNMPGTTATWSTVWTRGAKRKGACDAHVAMGG